jgi:hypothetical protein
MSEKAVAGATTTWRDDLQVDGKIIAERFLPVGGSASWKYFVLDDLSSIAVVTDSAGTATESLAGACPPARGARPGERPGPAAQRGGRHGPDDLHRHLGDDARLHQPGADGWRGMPGQPQRAEASTSRQAPAVS